MSKNSVTAAFSAQSLWAAGYLGKGVKMGVFDTGIRDDHPHVKNIKCVASSSERGRLVLSAVHASGKLRVSYVSELSACSHAWLVEHGEQAALKLALL